MIAGTSYRFELTLRCTWIRKRAFIEFDIHERRADFGHIVDTVMDLVDDAVVATGDSN